MFRGNMQVTLNELPDQNWPLGLEDLQFSITLDSHLYK